MSWTEVTVHEQRQNGIHEHMHLTIKRVAVVPQRSEERSATTVPPAASMGAQQRRFDTFRDEFKQIRPHKGIGMRRPADLYQRSPPPIPYHLTPYDYPAHYMIRRVSRAGTIC